MKRSPVATWALALLLPFLFSGCAGYRLGTMLPPNIRTIHISTFENKSSEPLVENEVAAAAAEEFQRDGTLEVLYADTADVTLTGTVSSYELEPLRYETDNQKVTSEYRLWLQADVVFTRNSDHSVLFKQTIRGKTEFPAGGDIAASKRQALPAAARDLAHNIVETIVEYW